MGGLHEERFARIGRGVEKETGAGYGSETVSLTKKEKKFNHQYWCQPHPGLRIKRIAKEISLTSHFPVEGGFLNEDVHGAEQKVMVGAQGAEGMHHGALHQTRLLQRHHQVLHLPSHAERHQFRHWQEL